MRFLLYYTINILPRALEGDTISIFQGCAMYKLFLKEEKAVSTLMQKMCRNEKDSSSVVSWH